MTVQVYNRHDRESDRLVYELFYGDHMKQCVGGILCFGIMVVVTAGCMTNQHGQKIEASQVSTIKKGVTTRAEIERSFGAPIATGLMPDGRRILSFTYSESRIKGSRLLLSVGREVPT